MALRHQLAAYSPITLTAGVRSLGAALTLTSDPRPRLLDLLLSEYEAREGVLCGSGTQALQLAITYATQSVVGSTAVALPGFSCFDIASAAIGAGVSAALYDIDPETLGPDWASLERVLASGVRIAVIAPLYGMPVDWTRVRALADRYGTLVIEDAAQGHGASWHGRRLGALGPISILSFGRGKGWTGGSGGALLVRGDNVMTDSLRVADIGLREEAATIVGAAAQWTLGRPALYGLPRSIPALGLGESTYHAPRVPAAMTRAAAAGVLANRDASQREADGRKCRAFALVHALRELPLVQLPRVVAGAEPGYLRLPLLLSGDAERFAASPAGRQLGLERSYPRAVGELDALQSRLTGPERAWPGSVMLASRLFTCPAHSFVSHAEQKEIVARLERGAASP